MESKDSKPESYKKIRELGKGACGKAYLVICESTKGYAVIKQIDINSIKTREEREKVYQESKILERLNHKYCTSFKEVYKTRGGKICIVMEYAEGGDLAQRINTAKTQRSSFSEETILDWVTQICLAMKHIHDRKIIHRDIKAQNVFLAKDSSIRLGDFGVARILDYTVAKAHTQVGTPYYIAPEILKGRAYTNKADIWSLGILIYELCALDVPIKAANLHELYKRIMGFQKVPALPKGYSENMKQIITSMLTVDASKRPTINDLLSHPAIKPRITKFMTEDELLKEFNAVIPKGNILKAPSSPSPSIPSTPSTPSQSSRPGSARSIQSSKEEIKVVPKNIDSRGLKAPKPYEPISRIKPNPEESKGLKSSGSNAANSRDRRGSKDAIMPAAPKVVQTPKFGMGARK